MLTYAGYQIIENADYFTEHIQIRFPKSKKKRIRKKWAQQPRNFVSRMVADILVDDLSHTLYMHPYTAQRVHALRAADGLDGPDYSWPFGGMLR